MRFIRLLVVPAALFVASSALADDSWSRVSETEIVWEEVSDGIFMPEGSWKSLSDLDLLLDLVEEDAQVAQKSGVTTQQTTTYTSGLKNPGESFTSTKCVATHVTITVEAFGTTTSVSSTSLVCGPT